MRKSTIPTLEFDSADEIGRLSEQEEGPLGPLSLAHVVARIFAWHGVRGRASLPTMPPGVAGTADSRGRLTREPFEWDPDDPSSVESLAFRLRGVWGLDVFLHPTLFRLDTRGWTDADTLPSRVLFHDLDEVDPRSLPESLRPTIAWETSPGSYQAAWLLDGPALTPDEHRTAQRRLHQAVNGGDYRAPSAFVRPPGRRNRKGENGPRGALGRFLWDDGPTLDPSTLPTDDTAEATPAEGAAFEWASPDDAEAARAGLSASVRALLAADTGDRSEDCHRAAKELLKAGLALPLAGAVLRDHCAAFHEKFGGRSDPDGQLAREIENAARAVAADEVSGNRAWWADFEELTHTGNAARFIERHGHEVRWVDQWKTWITYDHGRRVWRRDGVGSVVEWMKELGRDFIRQAASLEEGDRRKKHLAWGQQSLNTLSLKASLLAAQSIRGVTIHAEELDNKPWLWVLADGITVELRTGLARPSDPADLLTMSSRAVWDPTPTCPQWLKFLADTFPGEGVAVPRPGEATSFIQRAAGSTLVGEAVKWFFILQGPTDSGKSVFQEIMVRVFGDYAKNVKRDAFQWQRGGEGKNNDGLADLHNKRYARWSETEKGLRVQESLVKDVMDGVGSKKSVSRKYEKAVDIQTVFTLWMDTNNEPDLRYGDDALWNRVLIIHTRGTVPQSEQVYKLEEKIFEDEAAGIFQWALAGCLDWQARGGGKRGLAAPPEIEQAVKEYRADKDAVGKFLEAYTVRTSEANSNVGTEDLKAAWLAYTGSDRKLSTEKLNGMLESKGINPKTKRLKDPETGMQRRVIPGLRWIDGMKPEKEN